MNKLELYGIIDILFERMCKSDNLENALITYGKLLAYTEVLGERYFVVINIQKAIDHAFNDLYVEFKTGV